MQTLTEVAADTERGAIGKDGGEIKIHVVEENTPFVLEFERALDELLRCS